MESVSDKIYRIKEHLEELGCIVNLFAHDLDDGVAGRCVYDLSKIDINCPDANEALITILHEGGHWISYLRYYKTFKMRQPDRRARENYAYLYGWYLNKKLSIGITKEEWKKENVLF